MTSLDIRPGQIWMRRDCPRRAVLVIGIDHDDAKEGTLWSCIFVLGEQVGRHASFWFSCANDWTRIA